MPVLRASGLGVWAGSTPLVQDLHLEVHRGERVGLIGESGSGKSVTALALMGLLPPGLTAIGSVRVAGVDRDLVGAPEPVLSRVRGSLVSMVFQEPMTALDPTMRVGRQVAEVLQVHRLAASRAEADRAAVELLDRVGLPEPARTARAWPHQLSGGQRQRVVLAIALAGEPGLLICDEPTTALDVTVQARVLEVVDAELAERDAGCLFITHDLAVVARMCERVLVLHRGRVVEAGPVRRVLTEPRHPYTRGLLAASDLTRTDADGRLVTVPTLPVARPGVVPAWEGTPEDGWAVLEEAS
ncbi:ABC transporter ATP-binding protein [Auraticoccus monumenti]|uniref:ABC transporter ATP-binding protein n=1 Tax=Auraticoccus monumenti TaxID=675864 RepID=UPI000B83D2FA